LVKVSVVQLFKGDELVDATVVTGVTPNNVEGHENVKTDPTG
jgi:hypothetical protein